MTGGGVAGMNLDSRKKVNKARQKRRKKRKRKAISSIPKKRVSKDNSKLEPSDSDDDYNDSDDDNSIDDRKRPAKKYPRCDDFIDDSGLPSDENSSGDYVPSEDDGYVGQDLNWLVTEFDVDESLVHEIDLKKNSKR